LERKNEFRKEFWRGEVDSGKNFERERWIQKRILEGRNGFREKFWKEEMDLRKSFEKEKWI
jgi:hypothetical protein